MNDKLNEISRHARGYRFIDGLAEIGCGILLTIIGIPYLLWSLAPQGSTLAKVASNSKDFILLFGLIILFFVIRIVKQKSTYPRSGYIEERPPERKRLLKIGLILLACTLIFPILIGGFRLFPDFRIVFLNSMYYLPSIMGLFITAGLAVSGFQTGINRFYILAAAAALLSAGLMWVSFNDLVQHPFKLAFFPSLDYTVKLPPEAATALLTLFRVATQEMGIFFAIFGLAMLISGLVTRLINISARIHSPSVCPMGSEPYSLAGVDRIIHEPARSLILAILAVVEEADFLYLQRETGLTKGNLSAHLSRLEEAGYIRIQKTYRGKVPLTLCRLTETGRNAFGNYRDQLKAFVGNN